MDLRREETEALPPPPHRHLLSRRQWLLFLMIVPLTILGLLLYRMKQQQDAIHAELMESRVREFLKDEPLSNVVIRVPHNGVTGMLDRIGIGGPHARRGERALARIVDFSDPQNVRTKALGETIDACRKGPDGVPAQLLLSRRVPVADPTERFGPFSARSRGESLGTVKGIDFYTYGNLDIGIKDGELRFVRVR